MSEPTTAMTASQTNTLPLTGLTTLAFLIRFSGKNRLFITSWPQTLGIGAAVFWSNIRAGSPGVRPFVGLLRLALLLLAKHLLRPGLNWGEIFLRAPGRCEGV